MGNEYIFSALCELFDKADTGGDGTISLEEYMVMCDEYGIELTEEHLKEVRSISNDNGEVTISKFIQSFKLFFLMMFSGQEEWFHMPHKKYGDVRFIWKNRSGKWYTLAACCYNSI